MITVNKLTPSSSKRYYNISDFITVSKKSYPSEFLETQNGIPIKFSRKFGNYSTLGKPARYIGDKDFSVNGVKAGNKYRNKIKNKYKKVLLVSDEFVYLKTSYGGVKPFSHDEFQYSLKINKMELYTDDDVKNEKKNAVKNKIKNILNGLANYRKLLIFQENHGMQGMVKTTNKKYSFVETYDDTFENYYYPETQNDEVILFHKNFKKQGRSFGKHKGNPKFTKEGLKVGQVYRMSNFGYLGDLEEVIEVILVADRFIYFKDIDSKGMVIRSYGELKSAKDNDSLTLLND